MLTSLFIQNYVLIDELDIRFEDGFSVITGETGAGKSIILGALSLVLGERADTKSIQTGKDKCVIEAVFDISSYHLEPFFEANDLEYIATECQFRRELYSSGKSRAFLNDSPVQLAIVKELGQKLMDVHSQHQNLLLADIHFQLNVVDLMAGNESQLASYRTEYSNYLSLCDALEQLKKKIHDLKLEEDYTRFQYIELKAAKLKPGELIELEEEVNVLSHAEEIKTALYKISALLRGENGSVVSSLKETLTAVEQVSGYFSKANEYMERLRSSYIDMNDLASETDVLKDDVEFDPERLDWVNGRLNTIYTLQHKHKVASIEALITKCDDLGSKLDTLDSFDEALQSLTEQRQKSYNSVMDQATAITALRKKVSEKIEQLIMERMVLLGMSNTRFQILFTHKSQPAHDGLDEVSFLFSTNKNEPLKPVSQTASGGEISRLMLCVKAMIAGYASLPSILFDEIDTGVSGGIAEKMANIMQDLGQKMQVIAITHLPLIAAKGKAHYYVYKEDSLERTYTRIRRLDDTERIDEITRLLSGAKPTQAAYDNAKSLLGLL